MQCQKLTGQQKINNATSSHAGFATYFIHENALYFSKPKNVLLNRYDPKGYQSENQHGQVSPSLSGQRRQ
jgi:hypothetical protein